MTRPARRVRVNHAETAALLRIIPGEWQAIGTYDSKEGASKAAREIRGGLQQAGRGLSPYLPAGEFEAYSTPAVEGWHVMARYVGAKKGGNR